MQQVPQCFVLFVLFEMLPQWLLFFQQNLLIDLDIDASVSHNEHENTMVFNPKIYTAIRQIEY